MANIPFLVSPNVPALSADPASPSAGDIYFNTSTNKLRVYNGSTWAEWATASSGPTYYPTTLGSASNTTTETPIASFTIPANDMTDGDIIELRMSHKIQQNSGGAITLTLKFGWTGVGGTKWIALNASSIASGTGTGYTLPVIYLQRCGTGLRLRTRNGAAAGENNLGGLAQVVSTTTLDAATSLNTPSFAADIPMVCTATWGTANAAAIYTCTYAKAFKM